MNKQQSQSQSDYKFQKQNECVQDFFETDGLGEIVESMHIMVETYLFSKDLENVSPEMRVHLANQLRAASLIAKLGETAVRWKV